MNDGRTAGPQLRWEYSPAALVDAGGSPWSTVGEAVVRHLADMAPGDAVEVYSSNTDHRRDILSWCDETGNNLVQMVVDGDKTWFWVQKR